MVAAWTAHQACIFVGFARTSAEIMLTFATQRTVTILLLVGSRLLRQLIFPEVGGCSQTAAKLFGGRHPNTFASSSSIRADTQPTVGETRAWFVAVAQPILIG
eukprot:9466059-Pyramimonas_sp.AAC.1